MALRIMLAPFGPFGHGRTAAALEDCSGRRQRFWTCIGPPELIAHATRVQRIRNRSTTDSFGTDHRPLLVPSYASSLGTPLTGRPLVHISGTAPTGGGAADDQDNTRRGWSTWASRTRKHGEAYGGRPERGGGVGSNNRKTASTTTSTAPSVPPAGPRYRRNGTTRNTGCSGRQNALHRHPTRRADQ